MHLGLTSQDVWDTATALQLRDSATILEDDLHALREVVERRARRVQGHALHRPHARRPRRADDLRPQAGGMGRRDPPRAGSPRRGEGADLRRQDQRRRRLARHGAAGRRREGLHRPRHRPSSRSARRSCRATATRRSSTRSPSSAPSLERMAQEIRHLQRTEVLEAEEPFAEGQTGSSAMPHKRNPELCERICGLARVAARLRRDVDRERRALARARHLALVDGAHHAAGLVRRCSTTCSTSSPASCAASTSTRSACARTSS